MSVSTIILEYVCPGLGVISAALMFAAPLLDVIKANEIGGLGDLNPTPWAFMLGNTCGWIVYSFVINNLFVFFANAPGFCLSVWFNLQAIKLIYGDFRSKQERTSILLALQEESARFMPSMDVSNKSAVLENGDNSKHNSNNNSTAIETTTTTATTKSSALDFAKIVWAVATHTKRAPVAHEKLIVGIVILWVATSTVVAFGHSFDKSTRTLIVGSVVNANLLFFYGAPLSTIVQVLQTRSSATIHLPTMVLNTLNGVFWCAFGFAVKDYFIGVPNGLGALLGFAQMVLCVLFPRRPPKPPPRAAAAPPAGDDDAAAAWGDDTVRSSENLAKGHWPTSESQSSLSLAAAEEGREPNVAAPPMNGTAMKESSVERPPVDDTGGGRDDDDALEEIEVNGEKWNWAKHETASS